jgi:hypothetical protein
MLYHVARPWPTASVTSKRLGLRGAIMSIAVWVRRLAILSSLLAGFLMAAPAAAQYFGQNKVQYHSLKFEVLKTEHFDLYFYPEEREGAAIAGRLAERWLARLERIFGRQLRGRQPLVLYASQQAFQQTNIIGGQLGEGTGGVTESLRRRIILPLGGPIAETDHVIGHELVHAFQYDISARPDMAPGEGRVGALPLWFIEGMAEYLSIGPVDANTAMWLRAALRDDTLPTVKQLDNPRYFPYRWGQALLAYIGGRWGDGAMAPLLAIAVRTGDVDQAVDKVLGVKTDQLSSEWQASIRRTYGSTLETMRGPDSGGRLVIGGGQKISDLNVGPAISPDGRLIAFLSNRGFFSVDLYVADAATGRIVRQLTRTATDPHYSSLEFIRSAGTWDAEGRRLAVASVTNGQSTLVVFDAITGKKEREVPVAGVDEVLNPSWSPDGHAIVFTGMRQGLTDLYMIDLTTGALRQLTNDAYADLQPVWSPDGSRIAFATDRFTSELGTLAIGAYRIALIDAASGVITKGPGFESGKHVNPEWAPDGRSLYVISDQDGVSNVYRITLADGELAQVTAIGTGVSGITGVSPALSVAARTGQVAFTVYDDGRYDIYMLEPPIRGRPLTTLEANADVLPPRDRRPSEVAALLADASFGLPAARTLPTEPYRAKLSLESVGQPAVGVGVSRYGTVVGGGLSMYFGDMLGNHQLVTAGQFNSAYGGGFSAKDIGAQSAYVNRTHRWNWGVVGGQVPYLSGGFSTTVGTRPDGDLVRSDQLYIFRQTERSASGLITYPFDRARRVEFQGGFSHVSFDQTVTTTTYSLYTGTIYDNSTKTTSPGNSLTLGTSSAAYVFDTANFGATSPVQGQRYRVEVDQTFGTLRFNGVLADYRRYIMPVPFYTIAVRAMHYGRYGSGGEDARLYPLDIGYPGLVRGYDVTGITASECIPTPASDCPVIDRLLGSRMLIGNVEFRFPLLRPFGISRSMYSPVPLEVALFADAGVAWSSGQKPSIFGGSRDGVSSAGVAFRASVFGYAVLEFDIVRPFQRPMRGWTFGFNLLPAW